jgi:hypothetical protein
MRILELYINFETGTSSILTNTKRFIYDMYLKTIMRNHAFTINLEIVP